jgi:hypothetical protein
VDLSDAQALRRALAETQSVLRAYAALVKQKSVVQETITGLTARLGDVDKDVQLIDANRRMILDIEAQKQTREMELKNAQVKEAEFGEARQRLFGTKNADTEELAAETLTQKLTAVREQRRKDVEQAERAVLQNQRDIARAQCEMDNEARQLDDAYTQLKSEAAEIVSVSDAPDTAARFIVWAEMAARL